VIENALVHGLLLSLVLGAIMAASAAIAPDVWLSDYPPDVRARFGAMTPRAARLRGWVAAPFFAAFLGIPLLALARLEDQTGPLTFPAALASSYVVLLVFNAFDLVIVDWLVFCAIRPRWIVLPGTEGMPGYGDYRFHFVAFLKGLVLCAVASLVVALLWTALRALA
jgi:hypothetical protein